MMGVIIYPEPYFQFYTINYLAMKMSVTLIRKVKGVVIAIIFIALFSGMKTPAVITKAPFCASTQDSSASYYIKAMASHGNGYYYPKSVERFYQHNGYKLAWVAPETVKTDAWEGMLLLDCVMQFGLNHADYHPKELLYDKLHYLRENFDKASNSEKAGYDILLTDALITFMNNLHYGKLNPEYPSGKIDMGSDQNFNVENSLSAALMEKDFMAAVISVQPQSEAYQRLQYQMHLLTGLYTGDCYETPEDTIRKIAVNMERLRWIGTGEKYYIDINIPSYTLKVHQQDTVYQFKVIVGKPDTPTPTLESAISYFTTAPEWKVPKKIFTRELLPKALKDRAYMESNQLVIYDEKGKFVPASAENLAEIRKHPDNYYARQSAGCDNSLGSIVFRFPNIYDIYLHDTPEQKLFAKPERAFSHGCIRVENAAKLAGLLLQNDGAGNRTAEVSRAMKQYKTRNFNLKKPVPLRVTYLTCEVVNGYVVTYNDIYKLDKNLEMALYNITQPLTMK